MKLLSGYALSCSFISVYLNLIKRHLKAYDDIALTSSNTKNGAFL